MPVTDLGISRSGDAEGRGMGERQSGRRGVAGDSANGAADFSAAKKQKV